MRLMNCTMPRNTHFRIPAGVLVACLFFLWQPAALDAQERVHKLTFRNMSLGMGFNHSQYNFGYPELPGYENRDEKQSLLIDVRANFMTLFDLQFSSMFQLWSWTDNSGVRPDIPQNGMNDFSFLFDMIKFFQLTENMRPFAGAGGGVHFLSYWTQFPRFNPYIDIYTGYQLKQITMHKTLFIPDVLTGMEYQVFDGFFVTGELRYESAGGFRQWKFLLGISLFD